MILTIAAVALVVVPPIVKQVKRRVREYGAQQHKRGYYAGVNAAEQYLRPRRKKPSASTYRFQAVSDGIAADVLIIDAGCSTPQSKPLA